MNTIQPQIKSKGINRFVPHQPLKEVVTIRRKYLRRFKKLQEAYYKSKDAELQMKIMLKMKDCLTTVETVIPSRDNAMRELSDTRKSLPKKKQRELGLLPALK